MYNYSCIYLTRILKVSHNEKFKILKNKNISIRDAMSSMTVISSLGFDLDNANENLVTK